MPVLLLVPFASTYLPVTSVRRANWTTFNQIVFLLVLDRPKFSSPQPFWLKNMQPRTDRQIWELLSLSNPVTTFVTWPANTTQNLQNVAGVICISPVSNCDDGNVWSKQLHEYWNLVRGGGLISGCWRTFACYRSCIVNILKDYTCIKDR